MYNDPNEVIIPASVDEVLSNLPVSSISRAIGNSLYGLNLRQTGNPIPRSKDSYGFTFFTRPQLNLTRLNISNYRGFYSLLNDNMTSYQAYVRYMLDPRLAARSGNRSPFVDPQNPFIPILTNNLVSLSGWPDMTVPTYTSASGLFGQEHSIVDGAINHYEAFDLDATFRNSKGNPILYLFYVWVKYEALVFEGVLMPYTDMIIENEIDYNTRIYRIVLDQQKRYVAYIGATGASFPINVPTGNLFDYNTDAPYNTQNAEINIRFRSMGFTALDDILKLEFNKTLAIFNPEMKRILEHDMNDSIPDEVKARDDGMKVYRVAGSNYVKVPYYIVSMMDATLIDNPYFSINYKAYPYINLVTNEFEIWVDERRFNFSLEDQFKRNIENNGLGGANDLTG